MAAVKSKDTKPELAVRRIAHRLGYRFRLHSNRLPGRPDLVFPSRHAVIFVHGCFWHLHNCAAGKNAPKTNASFWRDKRAANRARDQRNSRALRRAGWRVLVIWQCQLKRPEQVAARIKGFLDRSSP